MNVFKKASKQLAKLKIAVTGPSGSGKTYSSLLLAKGLGGRVAVIDTENNSACLYADKFGEWTYDTLPIEPPFTVSKYIEAIEAAIKEKYDILVIDSMSHVWAGEGGLLEQKQKLDSRPGSNSYTNWQSITKLHEQLKGRILQSDIHVIATMRSKQNYILETNDKGKQQPRKVGMAPIQRDDMEYEFSVVFDIGMDHQFVVSKDRTSLFDGVIEVMNEKTGEKLNGWLANADRTPVAQVHTTNSVNTPKVTPNEVTRVLIKNQTHMPDHVGTISTTFPTGGGPAGEYLIKHGANTGKKLKDVAPKSLIDYRDRILAWKKATGKPISAEVVELLGMIDKYFSHSTAPPEFDASEEMPDFEGESPAAVQSQEWSQQHPNDNDSQIPMTEG